MKLETERLELAVLEPKQLRLWAEDLPALEQELACSYRAEPMEGHFLEIIRGQLLITEADPLNYPWHSFWLLIRKEDRTVVGSADFKDIPGKNGETEIGYGLGKMFEHNGYMTEAVAAMCRWAAGQEGVRAVIAETMTDNLASQQVLKRCGFVEYQREKAVWWRRRLPMDGEN
ncbi:MAG: GNAT family N-acetyltransferase [Oscillibacter sp.]|jgi:RimJ/RimL family protein N-acetyltransferase|nr:GNAT family N-acetyltransferase [Oscillibacter sp.]